MIKELKASYEELYGECEEYVRCLEDGERYEIELAVCDNLEDLVQSGVFHDAIGELVYFDNEKVIVEDEY